MADIEKVIKGLEFCISTNGCTECPYEDPCHDIEQRILGEAIMRDALELLKEQPKIIRCKDCIYYHKPEIGFTTGDCTYRTAWYPVGKEEFCSLARSKDGDGE